jgi:hypothetical protein
MALESTSYAVPQNPNQQLMDYRINGPMAGVMAMRNQGAWEDAMLQQKTQNETANRMNALTLENTELDQPLKAIKRENEMSSEQFNKEQMPEAQKLIISDRLAKLDDNQKKMAQNKAERVLGYLTAAPDDATAETPAGRAAWAAIVEDAGQNGINLPPAPTPEARAKLRMMAGQSKAVMEAMVKDKSDREKIAFEQPYKKELEEIRNVGRIAAGAASAQNRGELQAPELQIARDAKDKIDRKIPFTPQEFVRAVAATHTLTSKTDQDTTKVARDTAFQEKLKAYMVEAPKKDKSPSWVKAAKEVGLDPMTATAEEVASRQADNKVSESRATAILSQLAGAKIKIGDKTVDTTDPEVRDTVKKIVSGNSFNMPQAGGDKPDRPLKNGNRASWINGEYRDTGEKWQGQAAPAPTPAATGDAAATTGPTLPPGAKVF